MIFLNLILALSLVGVGFVIGLFVYRCFEARIDRVGYSVYLKKVKKIMTEEHYNSENIAQPPTLDDYSEEHKGKDCTK